MVLIFFCILIGFVSSNHNCGEKQYLEQNLCFPCAKNCLACNSSTFCNICDQPFFEYAGQCYSNCKFPYRAVIINDEVDCIPNKLLELTNYERVIKEYNSSSHYQSYSIKLNIIASSIETAFWIRFNEGVSNSKGIVFYLTEYINPIQTTLDLPHIMKLGYGNGNFDAGEQFQYPFESGVWYYISTFIEFPSKKMTSNTAKQVFVLNTAFEKLTFKVETESYQSGLAIPQEIMLFIGDISNNQNSNDYQLINFDIFLHTMSGYIGDLIFQPYLKEENLKKLSSDSNGSIIKSLEKFNFDTQYLHFSNFENKYIMLTIYNLEYNLPKKIFDVIVDEKIIFSCSFILKNNKIGLDFAGYFETPVAWPLVLGITIYRLDSNFYLFMKYFQIKLKGNSFRISISEGEDQPNNFIESMLISENSSIFGSFINLYSEYRKSEIHTNLNTVKNGIEWKFIWPNKKKCNPHYTGNRSYYFDKSQECKIEYDISCRMLIPNCDNCRNLTYCNECQSMHYNYEGKCFSHCPEGYILDKSNEVCIFSQPSSHISCLNNFSECLNQTKNCTECIHIGFNNKCVLSALKDLDCKPCEDSCLRCSRHNNFEICLECSPKYYLHNQTCVKKCPDNLIHREKQCLDSCDLETEIQKDQACISCKNAIQGYLPKKVCPRVCFGNTLLINNTCQVIPTPCLIKKNGICILCDETKYQLVKGICITNYAAKIDTQLDISVCSGYISFLEVCINCPTWCKDCYLNQHFNLICKSTMNQDSALKEKEFKLNISEIMTIYDCPEYIEGLDLIYINNTCLRIPNMHYYTIQHTPFFQSNLSKFKSYINRHFSKIKLCKNSTESSILCLDSCPFGFYLDQTELECKPCSDDLVFCLNKSELFHTLVKDNSVNIKRFIGSYFFYYDKSNTLLIWSTKPKEKCPITCKTCYFTGLTIICTSCILSIMEINHFDFICSCPSSFFDPITNQCVKNCPSLIEREGICLSNCDNSPQFMYLTPNAYLLNGKCIGYCRANFYPVIDYINPKQVICRPIISSEKNMPKFTTYQCFDTPTCLNMLNELFELGIGLVRYLERKARFVDNIETAIEIGISQGEKYSLKLLDLMLNFIFLNSGGMIYSNCRKAEKAYRIMQNYPWSLKIAYKYAYLSISLIRDIVVGNECVEKFYSSGSLSVKNEYKLLINESDFKEYGIGINLDFGFGIEARLNYQYFNVSEDLMMVFLVQSIPIVHQSFFLELNKEKGPLYTTIANISSPFNEEISFQENYKIYFNCIYFIHFSKQKQSKMELEIMMKESDFFQRDSVNIQQVESDADQELGFKLKISIITIFILLGTLVLVMIYKFFRRETDGIPKIKFVQMVEQEIEEENSDEIF